MDFINEYRQWVERSGGLTAAVKTSHSIYEGNTKKFSITKHKYSEKHLIPGNFYIFEYRNAGLFKMVKEGTAKNTPYYDVSPIVMSLGYDGIYEVCLNLNLLLQNKRVDLFNFIFKKYGRLVTENIESGNKNKPNTYNLINFNQTNIKSVLGLSNGMSIYNYDRQYIEHINAVDWDSIVMLSTLYTVEHLIINPNAKMNIKKLQSVASH